MPFWATQEMGVSTHLCHAVTTRSSPLCLLDERHPQNADVEVARQGDAFERLAGGNVEAIAGMPPGRAVKVYRFSRLFAKSAF
jgi:hypothetical protein